MRRRTLAHSLALMPLAVACVAGGTESAFDSAGDPPVGVELLQPGDLAALRAAYTPCKPTRSVGLPWRGHLRCGRLPPADHPRLAYRTPLVFATRQTHDILVRAAKRVERLDPGGPTIEIYDISSAEGGRSPFHLSHQSGRDVDVGYVYVDGFTPGPYFDVPPEALDAPRTWQLLDALIASRQVELILVDHDLQAVLRRAAAAAGVSEARLDRVFQYPRDPKARVGIIRHYPNHRSHFHVRFRCPPGHRRCRG